MDLELQGRNVVITGGSDGLGLALAELLATEGANVAICGRDEAKLAAAEVKLADLPGRCLALRCDVTEPAELEAFAATATEAFGAIHGLVNNAGRASASTLEGTSDAQWEEDFALKVMAAVRLTRSLLPAMGEGASIVNVLAISAKAPGAGTQPTSASRAAGMAITKSLSRELGPRGIRANAVLIGLIESGQWRRAAEASGVALEDFLVQLASGAQVPLGRVGRAAEFADLVGFLLSPRSSYVSGTAINLDGGLSPAS